VIGVITRPSTFQERRIPRPVVDVALGCFSVWLSIGLGSSLQAAHPKSSLGSAVVEPAAGAVETGLSSSLGLARMGPDVVVGALSDIHYWGREGDAGAYSIGTTACNVGTEPVQWNARSADHPVIAQNLYRLKDGRFEQIGKSWLKHGFAAANDSYCSGAGGCVGTDRIDLLGVGCSDTYSAYTNGGGGMPGVLGPRSEVNPYSGTFHYPAGIEPCLGILCRRTVVRDADLDPQLNAGARYFAEAIYVAADDARVGNGYNNASYSPVSVSQPQANEFRLSLTGGTVSLQPAIRAWRGVDPSVQIATVDVFGDGRVLVAGRVTPLGAGLWHYEYAVQNLNCERAIGMFSVPLAPRVEVQNVGFHDVDWHSGEIYDSADWEIDEVGGSLQWATGPYPVNPNANAIRWGNLYNFRFDANEAPDDGRITLGIFKPGGPLSVPARVPVPGGFPRIVSSTPPGESIDAGQPSDLEGHDSFGWREVEVTLDDSADGLTESYFLVDEKGGTAPAPQVAQVAPIDDRTLALRLSAPIEAGAWTMVSDPSGLSSTRLGFLPGDVGSDGECTTEDIEIHLDYLMDLAPWLSTWSVDVDRSGEANLLDTVRVVDVLAGAGAFPPFLGRTLPP